MLSRPSGSVRSQIGFVGVVVGVSVLLLTALLLALDLSILPPQRSVLGKDGTLSWVSGGDGDAMFYPKRGGDQVLIITKGNISLDEMYPVVAHEISAYESGKVSWIKIEKDGGGGVSAISGLRGDDPNPPPTKSVVDNILPNTRRK